MNCVKVIFKNPEYNYSTSVNPAASEESLRKYFIGNHFNMGPYPLENFHTCIDIEFTESK